MSLEILSYCLGGPQQNQFEQPTTSPIGQLLTNRNQENPKAGHSNAPLQDLLMQSVA
jgi:hypothetical protein